MSIGVAIILAGVVLVTVGLVCLTCMVVALARESDDVPRLDVRRRHLRSVPAARQHV